MNHSAVDLDGRIRLAAFSFLAEQTQLASDGVLSRTVLATGSTFNGTRVPLIGPQGIFKPAIPTKCRTSRQGALVIGPGLRARK